MSQQLLVGFVNHSGGAIGSDTAWEVEGQKYGVATRAYISEGQRSQSPNTVVIPDATLREADPHLITANLHFAARGINYKRRFPTYKPYIDNLLRRNWFQVKYADAIFAIGKLIRDARIVDGGTGWAVQMGIDEGRDVFVYDTRTFQWMQYDADRDIFVVLETMPMLTPNFAGIGTRGEIGDDGKYHLSSNIYSTIRDVYQYTVSRLYA